MDKKLGKNLVGFRNYGNRTIARVRDNYEERSKAFSQVFSLQFLTGGIYPVSLFWLIIDIIIVAVTYGFPLFIYGLYSKRNLTGVLVQGIVKKVERVK